MKAAMVFQWFMAGAWGVLTVIGMVTRDESRHACYAATMAHAALAVAIGGRIK